MITAETLFDSYFKSKTMTGAQLSIVKSAMIEFAKFHCIEQAKVISEKARTMDDINSYSGNTGSEYPPDTIVDKDSILNAYDLNNIK